MHSRSTASSSNHVVATAFSWEKVEGCFGEPARSNIWSWLEV